MRRYLIYTTIILAGVILGCSDGSDMTQDLRSTTTSTDEAVNVQSVGAGQFEFGLKLPEGHEQLDGKSIEVPSNLALSSNSKITLICRDGDRKESGSRIIVMLREQSGDGSIKNETVSFPYSCSNGALAKLGNLDPSYKYELRVLVLNGRGLIFKAQSDVFQSSVGNLVLKMLRVHPQDSEDVLVDIDFPKEEAKPRPAEARDSKIDCVFGEVKTNGLDSLEEGTCKAEPVKRVSIDGEAILAPPPSGSCKGSASCSIALKVTYPELYKVSVSSGKCSRMIYARVIPGEAVKISACLSE